MQSLLALLPALLPMLLPCLKGGKNKRRLKAFTGMDDSQVQSLSDICDKLSGFCDKVFSGESVTLSLNDVVDNPEAVATIRKARKFAGQGDQCGTCEMLLRLLDILFGSEVRKTTEWNMSAAFDKAWAAAASKPMVYGSFARSVDDRLMDFLIELIKLLCAKDNDPSPPLDPTPDYNPSKEPR